MIDWIVLFQNKFGKIVFVSSLNPNERESLEYYKFLEFINNEIRIIDFVNFKDQIDRFKTIQLTKDGKWEVNEPEICDATFNDLYAINGDIEEQEQKSSTDLKVEQSKNWLNRIFDTRKKEITDGVTNNSNRFRR
jgi:hypothetical protein